MANSDTPFGLRPYKTPLRITKYYTTSTQCIAQGSPVVQRLEGDLTNIISNTVANLVPSTKNLVVGVAAHFVTSSAARASRDVLVYDHPEQLFYVQSSATSHSAQKSFTHNFNLTNLAPGAATAGGTHSMSNRTTGQSKIELGGTSVADAASGIFMPIDWKRDVGWSQSTSWVKVVGKINPNFHWYGGRAGTQQRGV
jgi:hypothetical protein